VNLKTSVSKREYSTSAEPVPLSEEAAGTCSTTVPTHKRHGMYADENVSPSFRRFDWSPDGNLLLVTSGIYKENSSSTPVPVSYVFVRGVWNKPVAILKSGADHSVCAKFNHKLFKTKYDGGEGTSPFISLPYKLVFAIASASDVAVYTSESLKPIAVMKDMHCAEITDMSWSHTGLDLIITSQDGYCSIMAFEQNELGEEIALEEYPQCMQYRDVVELVEVESEKTELVVIPLSTPVEGTDAWHIYTHTIYIYIHIYIYILPYYRTSCRGALKKEEES
jgi:hypothetical protein